MQLGKEKGCNFYVAGKEIFHNEFSDEENHLPLGQISSAGSVILSKAFGSLKLVH